MTTNTLLLFSAKNHTDMFDFDTPEKPADKKQYEKIIDPALKQLEKQVEDLKKKAAKDCINRSIYRSLLVDTCAQIVAIHKEYQAQKNLLSYFFFKHPRLYDASLFCAGGFAGITIYWLFAS